ncbi:MAG: DUF3014 domain-containing protein [Acidobacteria bacterium]|nr:DUF3014 domain-containing protein [Acidobacteriota bacterium]
MPTYQKIVWIGLTVTVIAILVLGYFLFLAPAKERREIAIPETSSLAGSQDTDATAAADVTDPSITPLDLELDGSDAAVRELVSATAIPAAMKGWLQQKELVRTLVAVVDNIAQGQSPAALLPFLAPGDRFLAVEKNGALYLDPASYRRYDPLVNALTSVADEAWITWYGTLRPTLEKAFRELGYPGVTFAQRLQQAIEQLTQVPALPAQVALERKMLSYAYADAALEALNPAQKHLLRLGPASAARIQNKLRSLALRLQTYGRK